MSAFADEQNSSTRQTSAQLRQILARELRGGWEVFTAEGVLGDVRIGRAS
ncbi:MAG: hypothetical protein R8K46_06070 [Mariprofundaceae bacterium]